MNSAGSRGGKLASKYLDQGLRTIALDTDGTALTTTQKEWVAAGADYPLYDGVANCFKPFYKTYTGFPCNLAIKEGKAEKIYASEDLLKNAFGFK